MAMDVVAAGLDAVGFCQVCGVGLRGSAAGAELDDSYRPGKRQATLAAQSSGLECWFVVRKA